MIAQDAAVRNRVRRLAAGGGGAGAGGPAGRGVDRGVW